MSEKDTRKNSRIVTHASVQFQLPAGVADSPTKSTVCALDTDRPLYKCDYVHKYTGAADQLDTSASSIKGDVTSPAIVPPLKESAVVDLANQMRKKVKELNQSSSTKDKVAWADGTAWAGEPFENIQNVKDANDEAKMAWVLNKEGNADGNQTMKLISAVNDAGETLNRNQLAAKIEANLDGKGCTVLPADPGVSFNNTTDFINTMKTHGKNEVAVPQLISCNPNVQSPKTIAICNVGAGKGDPRPKGAGKILRIGGQAVLDPKATDHAPTVVPVGNGKIGNGPKVNGVRTQRLPDFKTMLDQMGKGKKLITCGGGCGFGPPPNKKGGGMSIPTKVTYPMNKPVTGAPAGSTNAQLLPVGWGKKGKEVFGSISPCGDVINTAGENVGHAAPLDTNGGAMNMASPDACGAGAELQGSVLNGDGLDKPAQRTKFNEVGAAGAVNRIVQDLPAMKANKNVSAPICGDFGNQMAEQIINGVGLKPVAASGGGGGKVYSNIDAGGTQHIPLTKKSRDGAAEGPYRMANLPSGWNEAQINEYSVALKAKIQEKIAEQAEGAFFKKIPKDLNAIASSNKDEYAVVNGVPVVVDQSGGRQGTPLMNKTPGKDGYNLKMNASTELSKIILDAANEVNGSYGVESFNKGDLPMTSHPKEQFAYTSPHETGDGSAAPSFSGFSPGGTDDEIQDFEKAIDSLPGGGIEMRASSINQSGCDDEENTSSDASHAAAEEEKEQAIAAELAAQDAAEVGDILNTSAGPADMITGTKFNEGFTASGSVNAHALNLEAGFPKITATGGQMISADANGGFLANSGEAIPMVPSGGIDVLKAAREEVKAVKESGSCESPTTYLASRG